MLRGPRGTLEGRRRESSFREWIRTEKECMSEGWFCSRILFEGVAGATKDWRKKLEVWICCSVLLCVVGNRW